MAMLIPIFPLVTGLRITEDDVLIRAEYVKLEDDPGYYHEDYYNIDEKTFLEVLRTLGVYFYQMPLNRGAYLEHFYADDISWSWFKQAFDKALTSQKGVTLCGFPNAKSAFLFGVLSAAHNRIALFQTTDDRHFWRMLEMLNGVEHELKGKEESDDQQG